MEDDEPVVALTLGRLRFLRTRPFLRSGAPAERDAVADPAMVASTGFARPALPRLVSTFSIWRSAAAMREYAFGSAGSHQAAVRADRARPFHHESAFVRFRPLASHGSWDGRDPLAAVEFEPLSGANLYGARQLTPGVPSSTSRACSATSSATRTWRGPAARKSGTSKPAARFSMLGMPCSESRPWIISASAWFWA